MRYCLCIDGPISAGKSTLVEAVRDGLAARGVPVAVAAEPVQKWIDCGILARFYAAVGRPLGPDDADETAFAFQAFAFVTRVDAIAAARRDLATLAPPARGPPAPAEVGRHFGLMFAMLVGLGTPAGWALAVCALCAAAVLAADARAQRRRRRAAVLLCERSGYTDRHVFAAMLRERFGPMLAHMYEVWWAYWHAERELPAQADETWVQVYLRPDLDTCMARFEARGRAGEALDRGYQAALIEQHDRFLLDPDFAGERPFAPEDVLVIDGALAASDFRANGAARDEVVARVVARLGL